MKQNVRPLCDLWYPGVGLSASSPRQTTFLVRWRVAVVVDNGMIVTRCYQRAFGRQVESVLPRSLSPLKSRGEVRWMWRRPDQHLLLAQTNQHNNRSIRDASGALLASCARTSLKHLHRVCYSNSTFFLETNTFSPILYSNYDNRGSKCRQQYFAQIDGYKTEVQAPPIPAVYDQTVE